MLKKKCFLLLLIIFSASIVYAQKPTLSGATISRSGSSSTSSQKSTSSSSSNSLSSSSDTTTSTSNQVAQGIDYSHKEEDERDQVGAIFLYRMPATSVKIPKVENPSMEPSGMAYSDCLENVFAPFYLSAGGLGRPHLQLDPLANLNGTLLGLQQGYMRDQENLKFYQVRRPYTSLAFGGSLNTDNQFHGTHSQNIMPRWNMAINYDLYVREGVYTRSALKNHYLDYSTNYYSRDNRYQVQGGVIYTRLNQNENGGIESEDYFYSTTSSTRAGVPVKLYAADNQWRQIELFAHQSYNTVRQVTEIIPRSVMLPESDSTMSDSVAYDTLYAAKPKMLNTGVFGLNVNYQRSKRNYYDTDPMADDYDHFFITDSVIYDSTISHHFSTRLFWTNDAYLDSIWHNPLKIYGGVQYHLRSFNYSSLDSSLWSGIEPFASAQIKLGLSLLRLDVSKMIANHPEGGDQRMEAVWTRRFKSSSYSAGGNYSLMSAPWFYYQYASNNFQWNNESAWGHQEKVDRRMLFITMEKDWFHNDTLRQKMWTEAQITTTFQQGAFYLDSSLNPHYNVGTAYLGQFELKTDLQLGWFNYQGHFLLQHSTNKEVFRVPTFATKNSLFADITLFNKALRVQTGFDVRYHTRYLADAYNPALAAFYRQDDIEVGNYLWADYFLTLKVRQANIYLRVSHFNALWENIDFTMMGHHFSNTTNYMTLPHMPGSDMAIYFGVIWQFFD